MPHDSPDSPSRSLTIKLPPAVYAAALDRATADDTTISQVAREAIRRYVGVRKHIAGKVKRGRPRKQ